MFVCVPTCVKFINNCVVNFFSLCGLEYQYQVKSRCTNYQIKKLIFLHVKQMDS